METKDIQVQLTSIEENVKKAIADADSKSREFTADIEKKLAELKEAQEKQLNDVVEQKSKEVQDQLDQFFTKAKPKTEQVVKTLGQAIGEKLGEYKFAAEGIDGELVKELKSKKTIKWEMPDVKHIIGPDDIKAMGLANNLTGDPVASYGPRQAILPSQKVNFRDLIPTLNTATGLYVFYRENATANNIGEQGEGCTKGENTYSLSEVKVVQEYIAGFVNFTKQMATSLPWLQQTLPRMLMRDYYKKENALFYTTVTAGATADTSAETDNVKKIVDFITAQMQLNYDVSAVIVSYEDLGALVKSTYTNGYYAGAGSVIINNGVQTGLTIMGVPIIGAAWATTGQALLIDNNFIERVQVNGLAIELSYENGTNFEKNQVTARIECQTEINVMLAASTALGTLA